MKKIFIILSLFLVSNIFAWYRIKGTQGGADSSTVGKWDFNESTGTVAYDVSGNGNNGAITGAVYSVDGLWGTCLDFDRSAVDYVLCDYDASFHLANTDYTIALWLKRGDTSADQYDFVDTVDASGGYIFGMNESKLRFCDGGWTFSNVTISDTDWHYIGVTCIKDDDVLKFYVDGLLKESLAGGGSIVDGGNTLTIAVRNWGGIDSNTAFDGILEEIKLDNRALSAAEIMEKYLAQLETMR